MAATIDQLANHGYQLCFNKVNMPPRDLTVRERQNA